MDQMDNTDYGGGGGGYNEYDSNQRPPPSKYVARPQVDPEACGEVDTDRYILWNCANVNRIK